MKKKNDDDTPANLGGYSLVVSCAHVAGCGTEGSRTWPKNVTPVQMGQVEQGKEQAHMRVYRARGYVENTVGRVLWYKEPCCQRCKGPGCGQKARLGNVANNVIYRGV